MKAIVVRELGGPEVLRLEEVVDPEPGPGQVVVALQAAGVNPVDTYIRSGKSRVPRLPYTPGTDGAGVVLKCGPEVADFAVGDRVFLSGSLSGTYAEQALCEAAQLGHLPARVDFGQGAAVFVPYVTAYRALFHRARCLPGETVLVHGASGGVGQAAVQLARAAGIRVLGTAGSEAGLEFIRRHGVQQGFLHSKEGYLHEIRSATGGQGPDVILEMLANVNLEKDLELLAPGGRVVVIGSRGRIELDPRLTMTRDLTVLGMSLFNIPPEPLRSIRCALEAGLENGTLVPEVGRSFPLAEAPRAHEAVLEAGAQGKIVLRMD